MKLIGNKYKKLPENQNDSVSAKGCFLRVSGSFRFAFLLSFVLLTSKLPLLAQYELQFNQLINTIEFVNPGYNAVHEKITGTLIYSNHWNGFPGSPSTTGASFHLPFQKNHIGIGAVFTNESLGLRELRTSGLSIDAAIRVGADAYITSGIFGGLQLVDYNIENATTSYLDELNNIYNTSSTVVGTGFNFFVRNLYIGISGYYHIQPVETKNSFLNDLTIYSHVSYWFKLSENWRLKTSGLYKNRGQYASIAEGGAFFLFKDIVWVGASYRWKNAAIAMADVRLSDYFTIGYAYAAGMGQLANFTGSSHEIQLRFKLSGKWSNAIAQIE